MKTITKQIDLYTYNELNEEAKEKVKQWYLEGLDADFFTSVCIYELYDEGFKNSDLKLQFSLSCCQGDGLNIYGNLYLDEALEVLKDNFNDKEYKRLSFYLKSVPAYEMPSNNKYDYCVAEYIDASEMIEEYNEGYRKIDHILINRFNSLLIKYFTEKCSQFEKEGYKYFYEVSEEDLQEFCNDNDYWFTESGEVY